MANDTKSGGWRVKIMGLPSSITIEQLSQSLQISPSRINIPKNQKYQTYFAWIHYFNNEKDAKTFVLQNAQLKFSNLPAKCVVVEPVGDDSNPQTQPQKISEINKLMSDLNIGDIRSQSPNQNPQNYPQPGPNMNLQQRP
ncbi:unnamed protein product, partial [Rotaria sordida]